MMLLLMVMCVVPTSEQPTHAEVMKVLQAAVDDASALHNVSFTVAMKTKRKEVLQGYCDVVLFTVLSTSLHS